MEISLPQIKLGKDNSKSNVFDFTHDCNTSSEFAFMQPVFCHELMPRSVMKLRLAQFVRLGAMNSPTFGRIHCKTYHRFVPYHELLPSFEYMLAGKPYYTNSTNYIPSTMPYLTLRDLTLFLLNNDNLFSIYKYDSPSNLYKLLTGSGDINTVVGWFNTAYTFSGGPSTPSYLNTINCNETHHYSTYVAEYSKPISLDGADFVVSLINGTGTSAKKYLFAFKLSQNSRRIRKIFIGCGYQLNIKNTSKKSVLPLFAFYKAWFDLFAPKQTVTWTSTDAFKILDRIRETNIMSLGSLFGSTSDLTYFLKSLAECYYTQKPDFVSANIPSAAISSTSSTLPISRPNQFEMTSVVNSAVNEQPYVASGVNSYGLTRNMMLAINKLTKFVNKNTIIGGKIADYLHVHYGADFGDDLNSYDIGQQDVNCEITEQLSTASTDKALLGEYAGKGIGADKGRHFTYRSNYFGCWISMMAIVPDSGYCQAIDAATINHLTRFDFPNSEFDALGFEITQKDQVCAAEDVFINEDNNNPGEESPSFGFIPRYSHCKVKNNVANGCISLRSTRTTYLPYMLDRWISGTQLISRPHEEQDGTTSYEIEYSNSNIPIASPEWRYLNKADYLGNLNRVFYNQGSKVSTVADLNNLRPIDDNFIVHNYIEASYIMPLLPISESFDTDENADHTLSVSKS